MKCVRVIAYPNPNTPKKAAFLRCLLFLKTVIENNKWEIKAKKALILELIEKLRADGKPV